MKLGLIGGGNMGEAVVAAALRAGLVTPGDVIVAERFEARRDYLRETYNVETTADVAIAAKGADVLVLAVKPQEFAKAAEPMKGLLTGVAVSIMAGVVVEQIATAMGTHKVVRSMPNTPAMVGEGMTAWTATAEVDDEARAAVKSIFAAMGQEAYVPDERYLDMVTALSGSGPAYVFMFIEALTDAGVTVGLTRDMASQMALQTVLGSALYARDTGKSMADLRAQVTSPAGTTAAAVRVLEASGLRSTIIEGVVAAFERSRELGEQGKK